ncbi:MAG: hypothetical protein WAR37_03780 [Candidatus Microsaccharimonas sp.]
MQLQSAINPTAYRPLLNVIAKGESNGNYNAYFSNANNTELRLTEMTIGEVLVWQKQYVEQGSRSNAVGRYQIIEPTLLYLVDTLHLSLQSKFDEPMQDKLAIALMERRGSVEFVKGELTKEEFAHNLSKEWAALPKVVGDRPDESYYAGDGLNASLISVDETLKAVNEFEGLVKGNK